MKALPSKRKQADAPGTVLSGGVIGILESRFGSGHDSRMIALDGAPKLVADMPYTGPRTALGHDEMSGGPSAPTAGWRPL